MGSIGKYMDYSMSVVLILWTFVGLISVAKSEYMYSDGSVGDLCMNMTPPGIPEHNAGSPYTIELLHSVMYYNTSTPVRSKYIKIFLFSYFVLDSFN